jgi:hypothetical protein
MAKLKSTMSIDEIEARLRRDLSPVQRNNYRRRYRKSKNRGERWITVESMARFAYAHYGYSGKTAHSAVRRILVEPPESEAPLKETV